MAWFRKKSKQGLKDKLYNIADNTFAFANSVMESESEVAVTRIADKFSDQVANALSAHISGDVFDESARYKAHMIVGGALAKSVATGLMAINQVSGSEGFGELITLNEAFYELACRYEPDSVMHPQADEFWEFLRLQILADSTSMSNALSATAAVAFHANIHMCAALDLLDFS